MYRKSGPDGHCKPSETRYSQYNERRYPPEKRYSHEERNGSDRKYTDSRYSENRYPESRYLENRYPDSRFAESRYSENRHPESRFSESRYSEHRYPESRYSESRYPESRFSESRQPENRHSEHRSSENRHPADKHPAEHHRYSSERSDRYRSPPYSSKRGHDSADHSSSEHQQRYMERDKDVYIRSRTFQNSNWRVPQTNPPSAWEKSSNYDHAQPIFRRDIAAVNSFMPHFCRKNESNYTPSLKAVDNLTPKFLNMDLNDSSKQQPQQKDGIAKSGQSGASNLKPSQSSANKSWREPSGPREDNSPGLTIRRKFHLGLKLSVADKEDLIMPKSLQDMLGSKRSLYEAMNELNSKTLKVQMDDYQKEEQCCEHLKQEMLQRYPNCAIIPYGTRLLGMAHPEAAIYLFFDTGNTYYQASEENKDLQTETRQTVCETMKNCGHCSEVNDWDRQELVTFRHIDTHMNCVVSFLNGFKDQNTLLLKSYLKIDKRLRLITLLVTDMVFRYHDISKHFTSYVLNIMVIMYLQKIEQPVLPTLQELRESFPYEHLYIGEFDCGFPNEFSFPTSSNDLSVETLLKGFCAFYRDFNYEDDVISILGPQLKRAHFCPPYHMIAKEQLGSYFDALRSRENTPKMNVDLPVIVQDPFELSCNAAEKVNLTVLEVFQMMCADAYDILSKWC